MNYREKGNKAFVDGEFETAWQEYTKGIEVTPEDPRLWSNRAQIFIKLGYPELAVVDATYARSLLESKIISGEYENADLALLCKSKWREAEALAKCDGFDSAASALERLFQIVNRRPVVGVDWYAWEREKDRYSCFLKVWARIDRYILVEQVWKFVSFQVVELTLGTFCSQERCTTKSFPLLFRSSWIKSPERTLKCHWLAFLVLHNHKNSA